MPAILFVKEFQRVAVVLLLFVMRQGIEFRLRRLIVNATAPHGRNECSPARSLRSHGRLNEGNEGGTHGTLNIKP